MCSLTVIYLLFIVFSLFNHYEIILSRDSSTFMQSTLLFWIIRQQGQEGRRDNRIRAPKSRGGWQGSSNFGRELRA